MEENILLKILKFGSGFIKNDIMFIYVLSIYKKETFLLSLFKIDLLNKPLEPYKLPYCS